MDLWAEEDLHPESECEIFGVPHWNPSYGIGSTVVKVVPNRQQHPESHRQLSHEQAQTKYATEAISVSSRI